MKLMVPLIMQGLKYAVLCGHIKSTMAAINSALEGAVQLNYVEAIPFLGRTLS
jgi:hypothetical protein